MEYTDLQVKILQELYNHPEGATGKQLAARCGVSLNTIRREFNVMYDMDFDGCFELYSRPSVGYQLEITDKEKTHLFFQKLISKVNNPLFDNNKSQTYKVNTIIRKLLTKYSYINITQLAELFNYSESSVRRDLKEVEVRLARFHLYLRQKKGYGYYIEGDEFDKRLCLLAQHKLFVNLPEELKQLEPEFSAVFGIHNPQIRNCRKTVRESLLNHEKLTYQLLDFPMVQNYTALIASRHKYIDDIHFDEVRLEHLQRSDALAIAGEVLAGIADEIVIDEAEITAFAAILQAYRSLVSVDQLRDGEKELLEEQVRGLLEKISQTIDISEVITEEDINYLMCAYYTVQNRMIFSVLENREHYRTLKHTDVFAEDLCICTKRYMEEALDIRMTENLEYHFYYIFDRVISRLLVKRDHVKLVLLSTYGADYARYCRDIINDQYGEYLESITVLEYSQMHKLHTLEFDYLVSDIRLEMLDGDIRRKTCFLEIQDSGRHEFKALDDILQERKDNHMNDIMYYEDEAEPDYLNWIPHPRQKHEYTFVFTSHDMKRNAGIYFYHLSKQIEFEGQKIRQIVCVNYHNNSFTEMKIMQDILH